MNNDRLCQTRRTVIKTLAGAGGAALLPVTLNATPEEMQAAIRQTFGSTPISDGRVTLSLPPLAENGNSVRLTVTVESPMTESDYVKSIHVLSEANPFPRLATFYLGPRTGKAEVSTRIRLAQSQIVTALAEMSDGSVWSGTAETVVTLAACIDLGI